MKTPTAITPAKRTLTAPQFHSLTEAPPEIEWFANSTNLRTRAAYEFNVRRDFAQFVGIHVPEECRHVTRAHGIAWRKDLEGRRLSDSSIRRKLAALSSFFDALCERNSICMPDPILR